MLSRSAWPGQQMQFDRLKRRDFITLIGGVAAAWPLTARAQQQPAMRVIGFLSGGPAWDFAYLAAAFRRGLGATGYVEGRNVFIEYRWAEGQYDRLPTLAADLVGRRVDVIAATGGISSVLAAKAATASIPIVFTAGTDPVKFGVVASVNRPGGNITGVVFFNNELGPKRLQVLRELVPNATVLAMIVNPKNPNTEFDVQQMQSAARPMGLQILVLNASSERELDAAFARLVEQRAGAVIVNADPYFNMRRDQLVALAAQNAVPAIYELPEFVVGGGLMSYGTDIAEAYRNAGIYAGRILKGDKPADLPVQQSTKFQLVINLKTAKALGLEVPPSLLARADEVIE
jgi:putative ABC transport system substrate-binding protein